MPDVVTGDEWLAARTKLLTEEKEITRRIDALNADRRRLPMVDVDKPYRFVGSTGEVDLGDLFQGRQLIVQHVMFHPTGTRSAAAAPRPSMSWPPRTLEHLAARETAYVLVSRALYEKLAAGQERKGWTVPWRSSFNYDFNVTMDPAVKPPVYNYRPLPWTVEPNTSQELPGPSCFLREGDEIFHTYSTFARGTDRLGGSYTFLDLTALGRQEEWEEPKGRIEFANRNVPDFS